MSATLQSAPALSLPALPYPLDALEPIITAKTLALHYDKHHRGYVETANRLTAGTPLAELSLEALIHASVGRADRAAIFNNASQAWNHDFYWRSLRPGGGGTPPSALKQKMEAAFGSVEECKKELIQCALSQFGSGWAWLLIAGTELKVVKTSNADNPITKGLHPLVAIDVWEHAYYLDYHNLRAAYVTGVIERLINWDFADSRLELSPGRIP